MLPTALGLGLLLVTGCGGGGSSTGPGAVIAPTAAPITGAFSTYATAQVTVGHNAAATVFGTGGPLTHVAWTQTAGPTVALLSDKSQAISFDPPQSGTYRFSVSFRDGLGTAQSQELNIPVGDGTSGSHLTLRVSQAVRMGGNVSIRAWPTLATGDSVKSIVWTQVAGPSVKLDTTDPSVAFFTAPSVNQDSLIRLKATMTTTAGGVDSDEAAVVVEKYAQAPKSNQNAVWGGSHISRVYPYLANGPYASVLVHAVYDPALQWAGVGVNLAPLSQLPFIAQESGGGIPTVEQVMNHVVVSHDWLGRNFEQFLRTQDTEGDFRRLLNGVTAIVLGAHVRPSFYYAMTGAIYLDADNFWLLPEERDTIDETPDYRSDFGNDLNFSGPGRYVRNNQYVSRYFYPDERVTRTLAYLLDDTSSLLYHELGHAADFLPPSSYASLNTQASAWGNIGPRCSAQTLASDDLASSYSLNSTIMYGLADVQFHGTTATDQQKAYTSDQVAGFFSGDRATDQYAYSSTREDVAMLFEEFMMSTRRGILRDVAVADKITSNTTGSNLLVRWGQRGRVGAVEIKPRITFVLARIAPWVDVNTVASLPVPIAMRAGESWTSNLLLSAAGNTKSVVAEDANPRRLQKDLRRHYEPRLFPIPAQ